MGRKIFVSYKYADENVAPLKTFWDELIEPTKVRDYVDEFQSFLEENDHINKGEKDGEDLSDFKDSTIKSKLRDKIFDSSITIVMISPNMKDEKDENDQWIPWEISYSLQETRRNGTASKMNAMLAIVLPDKNDNYDYFVENKSCCPSGCNLFHANNGNFFEIISDNMFNVKEPSCRDCENNVKVFSGDSSYLSSVRWCDFKVDMDKYLDIALAIREKRDDYNIVKIES